MGEGGEGREESRPVTTYKSTSCDPTAENTGDVPHICWVAHRMEAFPWQLVGVRHKQAHMNA